MTKKDRRYHKKNVTEKIVSSPVYDEEKLDCILTMIEQNILKESEKRGLSIRGLGEMCNIHYSHLSNIFSGKSHIGLNGLVKICIAFDMSPQEFFPIELNVRMTSGKRFEEIVKPLDIASVNFLLNFCLDYKREHDRIVRNLQN